MHRRLDRVHARAALQLRRNRGVVDERIELAAIGLQPVAYLGNRLPHVLRVGEIDLDVILRP